MTDDGNYIFSYKWGLGFGTTIGRMSAYLKVKLIKENNRTKIETLLRPNVSLVISFYLIIAILFLELTGNSFLEGPKVAIFIFLPAFDLLFLGMIMLGTTGLKNKFEKIMNLTQRRHGNRTYK